MENEQLEINLLSFDDTVCEQLSLAGKWSKFIAVVFILFGTLLLLALAMLLANFDELMTQIIKFNGVSDEMIEILEKRGEAGSATLFLVMAGIQFLIGISLLLFSNYSKKYVIQKANISMLSKALVYLKFYLLVSIILACLSAIPTIFTIFFLIASNL